MPGVHFTQQPPPESMFTDMQNLNRLENEQFEQLTSVVFAFLLEPTKSARMLNQLEEFADENGVNQTTIKNIAKTLVAIPTGALKQNVGTAQLKEDLITLGLSEDKATYFADQWTANLAALSRTALSSTLSVNQLVDMEWKFGVTAASSDMDKVGNTFLQLKLVINKGTKMENHYMELTLPQFYSFLHEMEKAKASLEYFS